VNKRGQAPFSWQLLKKVPVPFFVAAALVAVPAAADDVGDALDASIAAQRAARESQVRVDTLDTETRALQAKRRAAEAHALQLAAYAGQLEQEAQAHERRRDELAAELARVAATGTDLLPLAQRMLGELEAHVAADLPFLAAARRQRIEGARALLADPKRSQAEKLRRVLDAWRSEFEYGYTLGAEDAAGDCAGRPGTATHVRIGRVAFYCLDAAGAAARWDRTARRWVPIEDDAEAGDVARAVAMARGEQPAALLVLPLERAASP
jgi:hypothetical protein